MTPDGTLVGVVGWGATTPTPAAHHGLPCQ
jgi:hypothetical protein